MYDEGSKVTTVRPVKTHSGDWFLPGEVAYVLQAGPTDRVRVRCPGTGADGWLDLSDLVPVDTRAAATVARPVRDNPQATG